jgi:hypothetical protein
LPPFQTVLIPFDLVAGFGQITVGPFWSLLVVIAELLLSQSLVGLLELT